MVVAPLASPAPRSARAAHRRCGVVISRSQHRRYRHHRYPHRVRRRHPRRRRSSRRRTSDQGGTPFLPHRLPGAVADPTSLRAATSCATYGRRHRFPVSGPADSTSHPVPCTRSTPIDTDALSAGRFSSSSMAHTYHTLEVVAPTVARRRRWQWRRWQLWWRRRAAACYRRGPKTAVVAVALLPRGGRREAGRLPHRPKFSHSRRRCHRLKQSLEPVLPTCAASAVAESGTAYAMAITTAAEAVGSGSKPVGTQGQRRRWRRQRRRRGLLWDRCLCRRRRRHCLRHRHPRPRSP